MIIACTVVQALYIVSQTMIQRRPLGFKSKEGGRRKESGGALRLTRQVSDEKEKISKKALCIFNNKHRGEKVIETSGFDWLVVGTVNK